MLNHTTATHNAPPEEQPLLCLAMIVENGGKLLTELLEEARPWVDQIIIGDCGSQEGSLQTAISGGARVIPVVWEDDFSLARNTVLEQCTARWILTLGADEKISLTDWKQLRAWTEGQSSQQAPPAARLECRKYLPGHYTQPGWRPVSKQDTHNLPGGAPAAGFIPRRKIRLFPNGKGIHFSDCIHEKVDASVFSSGLAVVNLPLTVHNFGKMQNNPLRDKQHLKLARIRASRHPHSPTAWSDLADCATTCGLYPDALAALDRALVLEPGNINRRLLAGFLLKESGFPQQANLQLNAVAGSPGISDDQLARACHLRAEVALSLGHSDRVSHLLGVAIRLQPGNGHLYKTLALWHQKEKRADAERSALVKAASLLGEKDISVQPVLSSR